MGSFDTSRSKLYEKLERKVASLATEFDVPGVAVVIYANEKEEYIFHGITSVDNPLPVNDETHFQLGSISKIFTATAMMRLVEMGKINLSERVRTYIPELQLRSEETAANVTINHLLNHTAGWTGDFFANTGFGGDALVKFTEALKGADQEWPLGTQFSYSNSAVNLAGRVIEKVLGMSFEEAMRVLVFEPLQLTSYTYYLQEVITRRFTVGHYERDNKSTVSQVYSLPWSYNPAGGIVGTLKDSLAFAKFHLGNDSNNHGERILTNETLELMKQPTVIIGGGELGDAVGIGWLTRDIGGMQTVGHGGSVNGQESTLQLIPSHNFAVVIMTNADRGKRLHTELLRWIYEQYLDVKQDYMQPLALSNDELAELCGEYRFGQMYTFRMKIENNRLIGRQELSEAMLQKIATSSKEDAARTKKMFDTIMNRQPVVFSVLPNDLLIIAEGENKGTRHPIVRNDDRKIIGFNYGGRLIAKIG